MNITLGRTQCAESHLSPVARNGPDNQMIENYQIISDTEIEKKIPSSNLFMPVILGISTFLMLK